MLGSVVNNELERMRLWSHVRYHPDVFLEGLNKFTKGLSHDTQSPDWDFNLRPPKCERGMLDQYLTTMPSVVNGMAYKCSLHLNYKTVCAFWQRLVYIVIRILYSCDFCLNHDQWAAWDVLTYRVMRGCLWKVNLEARLRKRWSTVLR